MERQHSWLERVVLGANKMAILIAELALLLLMFMTVYAVVTRYVFRSPSIHAMELSTYLLLIIAWASIGWVHYEKRHVSMEALNVKLSGFWRRLSHGISQLTILIFCSVLVVSGSNIVLTAIARNYRSSTLLKFPLWGVYILIPIGGALLGLMALLCLKNILKNKNNDNKEE